MDLEFLEAVGIVAVFALRQLSREQGRREAKKSADDRRALVATIGDHEARLAALEAQAKGGAQDG